tara:strand:- start:2066 stop:2275 length:210 start_codon:yes stop_codon:yes gene_type:complete
MMNVQLSMFQLRIKNAFLSKHLKLYEVLQIHSCWSYFFTRLKPYHFLLVWETEFKRQECGRNDQGNRGE